MNTAKGTAILFAVAMLLAVPRMGAQQSQKPSQGSENMPGMNMSDMQHDSNQNTAAAKSATDAMSGPHMEMNAHMFMTGLRPENAADNHRAEQIVETLRHSIVKYKDYRIALADGFQIFLPNVPQPHYHFTNYRYALEAQSTFNPAQPTSLLYKKTAKGYELEGAMFTAPKNATDDELNTRVPMSVARWHKHINFCMPQKGASWQQVNWKQFGLGGSIATPDACEEAGGRWIPQIFGWMVHVYPFETDPEKIWAH